MIRKATKKDMDAVAALATLLWPDHAVEELAAEYAPLLRDDDCAVFLASDDVRDAGFAQVQLRRDYVEGTSTSPVGYLEGIFVREDCRGKGVARQLLRRCEAWAREKGCTEFASDCEIGNQESLKFHLKTGFTEANRIICFVKEL